MRIDFKPQRLVNALSIEEEIPNGIRRVLRTEGKHSKTIDMDLSRRDSLGEVYPKEYYISSYKMYDNKSGLLLKLMTREVTGESNSVTTLVTKNFYNDKYTKTVIVRNNENITRK